MGTRDIFIFINTLKSFAKKKIQYALDSLLLCIERVHQEVVEMHSGLSQFFPLIKVGSKMILRSMKLSLN